MKFGWKSITGIVVASLGYLAQPGVFDLLPPKVASIVTAAGAIFSVFGIRSAIANKQ